MCGFRVLLVYPNYQMVNLLPTNIGLLTASLRRAGYDVGLFDTTFYRTADKSLDEIRVEHLQVRPFSLEEFGIRYKPNNHLDDFRTKVEEFRPNLIGVTTVEDTAKQSFEMLDRIRDLGVPTIIGGIYPTLSPAEAISHACVDSICIGEGEAPLVEYCDALREGRDPTRVPNLWVKRTDGGVARNAIRPPANLNECPLPDFDLFEKERFYRPMQGKVFRMIPVEFSRGCPYQCTFCEAPSLVNLYKKETQGIYYRRKRPEVVADQIRRLVERYDAQYLYFNDEVFLAMSEEVFDEFIEMYRGIRLPFWMQTRVETITDRRVALLEEVGCDRISIGLESGNENLRRKIVKKPFTNDFVVKTFEIFRRHRIPITVNNIIGFPDETREMIFDTIELNRRIHADSLNCYYFVPYRGTPLHEYAVSKGYVKDDLETHTLIISAHLDQPQLPRGDVEGLVRTFPLYVKMPKELWPRIRRAERKDEEGNRIFQELAQLYWERYFNVKAEYDRDFKAVGRACFFSGGAAAEAS